MAEPAYTIANEATDSFAIPREDTWELIEHATQADHVASMAEVQKSGEYGLKVMGNHSRRVMMTNIPKDIALAEVLDIVHQPLKVISITECPKGLYKPDFKSALVEFDDAKNATAFVLCHLQRPIKMQDHEGEDFHVHVESVGSKSHQISRNNLDIIARGGMRSLTLPSFPISCV